MSSGPSDLASRVVRWQVRHGRNSLPWQNTRDPYRVWLSEIMLQQTTVAAVIAYFDKFTARWPDFAALASADDADVMAAWAGLGYYSRARNLIKCARAVVAEYGGKLPQTSEELAKLPGIGPYTAAAIAGLISSLPVQASPTNKTITLQGLSSEFSSSKLEKLVSKKWS